MKGGWFYPKHSNKRIEQFDTGLSVCLTHCCESGSTNPPIGQTNIMRNRHFELPTLSANWWKYGNMEISKISWVEAHHERHGMFRCPNQQSILMPNQYFESPTLLANLWKCAKRTFPCLRIRHGNLRNFKSWSTSWMTWNILVPQSIIVHNARSHCWFQRQKTRLQSSKTTRVLCTYCMRHNARFLYSLIFAEVHSWIWGEANTAVSVTPVNCPHYINFYINRQCNIWSVAPWDKHVLTHSLGNHDQCTVDASATTTNGIHVDHIWPASRFLYRICAWPIFTASILLINPTYQSDNQIYDWICHHGWLTQRSGSWAMTPGQELLN